MMHNPFLLATDEQFSVGESNFACLEDFQGRLESGAVILCRKGRASLLLDDHPITLKRYQSLVVLPNTILHCRNRSADFEVCYFAFSSELFLEAAYRIPIEFIRLMKANPIQMLDSEGYKKLDMWMLIIEYSYRDKENRFRNIITKNRLQNALLEAYDLVLRRAGEQLRQTENTSRQQEIFARFMDLVGRHYAEEREVSYYAEQLCISTRYLSSIVRSVTNHTAKEIIDHTVLLEIKSLLQTTDLSVQEIAYRLNFPDQSYLGRFFRKQTGLSPTRFRQKMK
ncbi:MAG: helix-turn-helix domain-containing protein [Rikenellaceae bacterium]|nr:helix-turn-helix domain-containing protein [Rikenellaceae bacterium]